MVTFLSQFFEQQACPSVPAPPICTCQQACQTKALVTLMVWHIPRLRMTAPPKELVALLHHLEYMRFAHFRRGARFRFVIQASSLVGDSIVIDRLREP